MVRHAASRMSQGSITFTSGSLSSRPRPRTAMLTAILSAVEALAPTLALELAPVRVNAVTGVEDGASQPWRVLYNRARGRGGIPGRAGMTPMKRNSHPLQVAWKGASGMCWPSIRSLYNGSAPQRRRMAPGWRAYNGPLGRQIQ